MHAWAQHATAFGLISWLSFIICPKYLKHINVLGTMATLGADGQALSKACAHVRKTQELACPIVVSAGEQTKSELQQVVNDAANVRIAAGCAQAKLKLKHIYAHTYAHTHAHTCNSRQDIS